MTPRRVVGPLERLPQAIAEQVVRRIVEVLDIDEIVRRVDIDAIVQRVDVNALMQRVDLDGVIERVDVNAVIDRVDANELMDRVDIDRIVDRLDINAIAAKIDVEAIAERIEIDELVKRADLGPIIAQSTSGMLGEFLGLLRRQVVSLDNFLDKITFHGRRAEDQPLGPPALASLDEQHGTLTREGQFAGGVTRLLAFLADIAAAWGIFLLVVNGVQAAIRLLAGSSWTIFSHRGVGLAAIIAWGFLYFSYQWALSGRTIGMAILGARVVTAEGHSISTRAAVIRTLVLPFSIVLLLLGLVGIVLRADRRTFHDLSAGTVVVYFWEARGASVPWLHRDD